jgi:hypothetical protein
MLLAQVTDEQDRKRIFEAIRATEGYLYFFGVPPLYLLFTSKKNG